MFLVKLNLAVGCLNHGCLGVFKQGLAPCKVLKQQEVELLQQVAGSLERQARGRELGFRVNPHKQGCV